LLQAVLVLNKLKKLQLDIWIIYLQFRHGNVLRLKQKSSLLIKRTIISLANIFGGGVDTLSNLCMNELAHASKGRGNAKAWVGSSPGQDYINIF